MITTGRHIRRKGVFATLEQSTLALLCPCDVCAALRLSATEERIERNRRNRHAHPACPFCYSPMIWRDAVFVCPYSETPELHEEIRLLNTPKLRTRARCTGAPVEGGFLLQ